MKGVKGGSSRMVSETLKQDTWFAWQPNYAAFSVSPSHKNRVVRYIENQKQHHRAVTVWPETEEYDEAAIDDDP